MRRGFTLIEVLLAVAIFATVMAIASAMFARSLRYYGESQTMTENMMQMKVFANRLGDEFSSALPQSTTPRSTVFAGNATDVAALVLFGGTVRELHYAYDRASGRVVRRTGADDRDPATFDAEETALRNVGNATFEYYNGTAWSSETAVVPRAVRVTCALAKGTFAETLQETVYIPVGE